jgi:hypothetical protein
MFFFVLVLATGIGADVYVVGPLNQGPVSEAAPQPGKTDPTEYDRLAREEALRNATTAEEKDRRETLLRGLESGQLLQPGTRVAELRRFGKKGAVVSRRKAVFFTDLDNDYTEEALCACTAGSNGEEKTFLAVFEESKAGYSKCWEGPACAGSLWIQGRRTTGFQVLNTGTSDCPRIILATSVADADGCSFNVVRYSTNSRSYAVFDLSGSDRFGWFSFSDLDDDGEDELRVRPLPSAGPGPGDEPAGGLKIFKWGENGYVEIRAPSR